MHMLQADITVKHLTHKKLLLCWHGNPAGTTKDMREHQCGDGSVLYTVAGRNVCEHNGVWHPP